MLGSLHLSIISSNRWSKQCPSWTSWYLHSHMQPSHRPIHTPWIKTNKNIFKNTRRRGVLLFQLCKFSTVSFKLSVLPLYLLGSCLPNQWHQVCLITSVMVNLFQSTAFLPIAQQHHLYYMLIIAVVFGRKDKFVSDFSYPLTITYSVFKLSKFSSLFSRLDL